MNSTTPNIFTYATSELSQDAMFCWLISWASPEFANADPYLHQVGQNFVRLLTGKGHDYQIDFVDVGRQWENIDIWAEINDDTFLVVEDKTGTSIHGNQLSRYKSSAEKEYNGKRDLCLTYVKTGNEPQSVLRKIREAGYRTITRKDILECLASYNGDNQILISYRAHLQGLEDATMSFCHLPEKQWGWDSWQGFYMELERRLDIKSWEYVANPSGGFLGAWWHFVDAGDVTIYLQFEQGKLCFKIANEGDEDNSAVRSRFHSRLMNMAIGQFPEIRRPDRFGNGTYMTIAVIDEEDIFGKDTVDIETVVRKLKKYEKLLDNFSSNR